MFSVYLCRLLATLYKDERVRERPELQKDGVAAILEKMYLGTLVKREHVRIFYLSLCITLYIYTYISLYLSLCISLSMQTLSLSLYA